MLFVKKFQRLLLGGLFVLGLFSWPGFRSIAAQDDQELRITAIDLSEFPLVGVRFLAQQPDGLPVTDLSNVVLRENRTLISERTLATEPAGIDLVIVLDANPSLLQADSGDEVTRLAIVTAALDRHGQQTMNPDGLDTLSIIVVDETGEGASFLVKNARQPEDIAAALAAYDPLPPYVTPLQGMLDLALDHLQQQEDGRFQAVLLLTDGSRLDRQLDYPALVEKAVQGNTPLFVGLLGASADENELANVEGLFGPTGGQYVHIPQPEAADSLFLILQQLGEQPIVEYRSLLREGGDYLLTLNLGNNGTSASFTLDLQAPQLSLALPQATVTRAGSAADTPLSLLQPAVLPLAAEISWPDNHPRQLMELQFLVNGRRQPMSDDLAPDDGGRLTFTWDISGLDAGAYEILIEARDELGYQFASEPVVVSLQIDRPSVPLPAPVNPSALADDTPGSLAAAPATDRLLGVYGANRNRALLAMGAVVMVGLAGLFIVWLVRRRRRAATAAESETDSIIPAPVPANLAKRRPFLLRLGTNGKESDRLALGENDLIIGRDPAYADLILDDPTVTRLHARVRCNSVGQYWLYDEGSARGTFLNHDRLGLAPREMRHGDAINFGRVAFRFVLEPVDELRKEDPPEPQPAITLIEESHNSG